VSRKLVFVKGLVALSLGVLGLLGVNSIYAWYVERNRVPRVVKALEKGSRELVVITDDQYYPRPKEEAQVKPLLSPSHGGFFNLITGEHGSGKTTLVRSVCHELGSGVVYHFLPEQAKLLANKLGAALDYDFETHLTFWSQFRRRFFTEDRLEPSPPLESLLDALAEAAIRYRQKHKRPAVLVIDNFTTLAKADVPTFERLVKFAKKEADEGNIVVTFVASEGHTPRRLTAMSESSRLGRTVEIGDLGDEDAVHYLVERQVPDNKAREAVGIVGGRLRLLKEARTRLGELHEDLNVLRASLIGEAEDRVRQAKLSLSEDPSKIAERQRLAWSEIIHVLDAPSQEIPAAEFVKKVGGDELADDLLRSNVFGYHHNRRTVGIQSRPMALFLGANVGSNGSPQRTSLQALLRDAARRSSAREDI